MYVNFTVSDNIFQGNRLPRMLTLNLEAASNGCCNQSHEIQVLPQKNLNTHGSGTVTGGKLGS